VYAGPCRGDSGGPLYVNYGVEEVGEGRRQTVEGIVSGGLACGLNIPSWFTRVSAYHEWIMCIVNETKRLNDKAKVERICDQIDGNFSIENLIPLS